MATGGDSVKFWDLRKISEVVKEFHTIEVGPVKSIRFEENGKYVGVCHGKSLR